MIVLKCKMCDANLEVNEGEKTVVCEYCGTRHMFPEINKEGQAGVYDYTKVKAVLNHESLYQRGCLFLEDGFFDRAYEYYDRVLDIDPSYALAYVGKLCAEFKCKRERDLGAIPSRIDASINLKNAKRFGDEALIARLDGYCWQAAYNMLIADLEATKLLPPPYRLSDYEIIVNKYEHLSKAFSNFAGFRDAKGRSEECYARAQEWRKKCELKTAKSKRGKFIISIGAVALIVFLIITSQIIPSEERGRTYSNVIDTLPHSFEYYRGTNFSIEDILVYKIEVEDHGRIGYEPLVAVIIDGTEIGEMSSDDLYWAQSEVGLSIEIIDISSDSAELLYDRLWRLTSVWGGLPKTHECWFFGYDLFMMRVNIDKLVDFNDLSISLKVRVTDKIAEPVYGGEWLESYIYKVKADTLYAYTIKEVQAMVDDKMRSLADTSDDFKKIDD